MASPPCSRRAADTSSDLAQRLRERIHRNGPIPFEQYVEAALYDPEAGFYATGGQAGRRGDFLTSPEVGPLFGAVLARAIDEWWEGLGRPDPYFVIDAGAGPGTLARSVLAAEPVCRTALRYVLVERSPRQRARHHEHLPLEPADEAFAALARPDEPDAPRRTGIGPIAVSLAELPEEARCAVVVANELLDNLPFALCQREQDGWAEVWVTTSPDTDALAEVLVPARPAMAEVAMAAEAAARAGAASGPVDVVAGSRLPVQVGARAWLAEVLDRLEEGRVVVLDYTSSSAAMVVRPWTTWLRTYAGHERGGGVLDDPGGQDITVDVALDQLARVRAADVVRAQAEFLAAHGLDDLVEEGRRRWQAGAATGDLEALRARSRVREAEALTDPGGLGAFTVAEWVIGPAR